MNQKTLFAAIIITGLISLKSQPCLAQNAVQISGQRLADIEQEMFKDSNDNFVVVNLMIDGIMKPGDDCNFWYNEGVVYFNDKKINANLQEKYVHRFKEFLAYTGQPLSTNSWRMRMGPVTTEKILDPNSSFRNPRPNMLKLRLKTQQVRTVPANH